MSVLLQAAGIRFGYGERLVLRGVGVGLEVGEVLGLLGPNGSGKSTLIKVLLGHLKGEGEILWEGRGLERWQRKQLAKRVAYLPQSPAYEPEQTVAEALRLGRAPYWGAFGLESEHDLQVVERVGELLQLTELMDRPMEELSGGQRQRVFIGRCLAQEPRALLLDEPSTYLDLRHQVELLQILRKLAKEKNIAILMASHDLNLAGAYADRLALLSEGKIVAEGNPRVVLEPGRLQAVYGVPMERVERGEGRVPIVMPWVGE